MMRWPLGKIWGHLVPFLPEGSRLRIGFVGVASFLGGLAESAVLVLLTLTADSLIRGEQAISVVGSEVELRIAVFVALGMVVIRVGMTLIASRTSARFSGAVMGRAQAELVSAYLTSSHTLRSGRPAGDLSAVTVNHGRFTGELASSFAIMAASVCGLAAFGGTSLIVNPAATLGISMIGGVVLLAMRPIRTRSQHAAGELASTIRDLGQEVTEVESLHREIEVFNVRASVESRLDKEIDIGVDRYVRIRFLGAVIPQLFQAALLAAAVLSLLVIVDNVGNANLAAVGAVVLLLIRSMSSAQQLVTANQRIIEYGTYAAAINELIATLRSDPRSDGSQRPLHLTPIEFDDVGFSYDGVTQVLTNLRLAFDEGDLIGVVGPSGAGKSTLVELLLRLRSPTAGRLRAGGVDLSEVDPAEFARRVAFVPQQPTLIAGTVAENVDLFRNLPEDRLRAAIKEAHLADEIDALPDGIHTRLGADDRALSGGQRQRLTIARALAGDPEILVLDEPTSALDAVSEHAIRRTLAELPAGRLVIIVAHRYSTLRSCSRILVLRGGAVEVDASPEEVIRRSDFFRAMVDDGSGPT